MNDICELWSLPWHALQKNLALGLGDDARGSAAPVAPLKTVKAQCVAASTSSWLRRAQCRTPPVLAPRVLLS